MYDHIGLQVKDLAESVRFYGAVLAPLGHVLCSQDEASASFGPKGAPALYLAQGKKSAKHPVHVALHASDHSAVKRFHAAGLESGGVDNGAPGLRTDYSPSYYAAFLLDPDGNNVEAVCTGG